MKPWNLPGIQQLRDVGGEKVSHWDLDLLLPARGDRHQKRTARAHVKHLKV